MLSSPSQASWAATWVAPGVTSEVMLVFMPINIFRLGSSPDPQPKPEKPGSAREHDVALSIFAEPPGHDKIIDQLVVMPFLGCMC
ncbi:hypothetical protein B0J17DRAFT_659654 [Rhizoctonia solani]|nr:hypothetical protein B0J17DRAFT_659654 [Rhizoctonia solani]